MKALLTSNAITRALRAGPASNKRGEVNYAGALAPVRAQVDAPKRGEADIAALFSSQGRSSSVRSVGIIGRLGARGADSFTKNGLAIEVGRNRFSAAATTRKTIETNNAGRFRVRAAISATAIGQSAPIWTTVPTISFQQGIAGTFDVTPYVTDPNGDPLTLSKNATALPTGVTFNAALKRYEYNGTSPVAGTNGHVITAEDNALIPGNVEQGVLWDGPSGATFIYWNLHLRAHWQNLCGDWFDANDSQGGGFNLSGQTSFAQQAISTTGDKTFNVLALVNKWRSTGINSGLILTSTGGQLNMQTKEAGAGVGPRLSVVTNQGTFNCPCTADTQLQMNENNSIGTQTVMRVSNGTFNCAVRFDISAVPSGATLTSATLTLNVSQVSGATTMHVMRLRAPTVFLGDVGSPELGIAANVVQDANIQGQPGFLYRKQFLNASWSSDMVQYGFPQTSDPSPGVFNGSTYPAGTVDNSDGLNHAYMRGVYQQDQNPGVDDGEGCTSMNGNLRFDTPHNVIPAEPTEAYVRWYLMIENDWDTTIDVSKMPGFHCWVTNPFDSGDPATGANGWSARQHIGPKPTDLNPYRDLRPCGNYVYHLEQSSGFGDSMYQASTNASSSPHNGYFRWGQPGNYFFCLQKDRWYCIEERVKLNTVPSEGTGLFDGVLEQWVNGQKVFSRSNIRWRTSSALKIEQVWFTWYHGGLAGPNTQMHYRMADLVLASSYIGPKRAS